MTPRLDVATRAKMESFDKPAVEIAAMINSWRTVTGNG